VDLAERIISLVAPHPAIRTIQLVGSHAEGRAHEFSDWDFGVQANDFAAVAAALPHLLSPLDPLVQQWDRLSPEWCWMLVLRGPLKVDLIFSDEPHTLEPPWEPNPENLDGIEAHFWDWMLWLRGKEAGGKTDLTERELEKLFNHLLAPLSVEHPPSSITEAIADYQAARGRAERRFGVTVRRDLEDAVTSAFGAAPRSDIANPS
jgi:hypothetical protein